MDRLHACDGNDGRAALHDIAIVGCVPVSALRANLAGVSGLSPNGIAPDDLDFEEPWRVVDAAVDGAVDGGPTGTLNTIIANTD